MSKRLRRVVVGLVVLFVMAGGLAALFPKVSPYGRLDTQLRASQLPTTLAEFQQVPKRMRPGVLALLPVEGRAVIVQQHLDALLADEQVPLTPEQQEVIGELRALGTVDNYRTVQAWIAKIGTATYRTLPDDQLHPILQAERALGAKMKAVFGAQYGVTRLLSRPVLQPSSLTALQLQVRDSLAAVRTPIERAAIRLGVPASAFAQQTSDCCTNDSSEPCQLREYGPPWDCVENCGFTDDSCPYCKWVIAGGWFPPSCQVQYFCGPMHMSPCTRPCTCCWFCIEAGKPCPAPTPGR